MYGGHIVEDWDRRLATSYLCRLFNESLLDVGEIFQGFFLPSTSSNHHAVRVPMFHFTMLLIMQPDKLVLSCNNARLARPVDAKLFVLPFHTGDDLY